MSGKIGSRWWRNTCGDIEIMEVGIGSLQGWLWRTPSKVVTNRGEK